MTLLELITILKLEKEITVPVSITDLKIVNEDSICRNASLKYFKSDTYKDDLIYILDDLVEAFSTLKFVSVKDFYLVFEQSDDNGTLHLKLSSNCN